MARIPIKTPSEVEGMRRACRTVSGILDEVAESIQPGSTTREVDQFAAELISNTGGKSAFLGYRGFPGNICISVNEEVVHGIGGDRKIKYGDVVKLDIGILLDGWIGDTALSVPVGAVTPEVDQLLRCTERSLAAGIDQARAGRKLGDISSAIEKVVVHEGYSIVRDFVGHGVGRTLHEEPQIPNYGKAGTGPRLKAGMIFAIEPMVNLGGPNVKVLEDGWTVIATDRKCSSHFEHTVLITEGEPEILTCREASVLK